MARIPYLTHETAQPAARELFERIEANGFGVMNFYRVVMHAPEIGQRLLQLGNAVLFKGPLPRELRELAILRVAQATGSDYEGVQHERIARELGLAPEKIAAARAGADDPALSERERVVVRFAGEVSAGVRPSPETFARAQALFSAEELVQLTITVGFYNLVSRVLETFEVELEADDVAFQRK